MAAAETQYRSEHPLAPETLHKLGFAVPARACDSHMHVFGSAQAYAGAREARYTLPPAGVELYSGTARILGLHRAVLVQPSYYGTDNSCLLDVLEANPADYRGVVMVDPDATPQLLDSWTDRGVRGLRLDLFKARAQQMTTGQQITMILKACDLAGRHGWSVDLYVPGRTCLDIAVALERASCPITVAHMGYLTHAEGITDAECEHFVGVVRESRRIWPKLSGAYRYGPGPGQARAQMLARALLRAAPTRVLWGSDWPHVMAPAQDSGVLLENAAQHALEPRDLYAMLVENPATLYGF